MICGPLLRSLKHPLSAGQLPLPAAFNFTGRNNKAAAGPNQPPPCLVHCPPPSSGRLAPLPLPASPPLWMTDSHLETAATSVCVYMDLRLALVFKGSTQRRG